MHCVDVQTTEYDAKLMTLAALMSSMLVMNVPGTLDQVSVGALE
jgi:hypothetical protein